MDDEKYQKELFEFEKPKRFFPRLSAFFPRYDFERNIAFTFTLEKAVFVIIGIIMAMIAVYALGVEAGRSRAKYEARAVQKIKPQQVSAVRNTLYKKST